jgi:hypothetical protein
LEPPPVGRHARPPVVFSAQVTPATARSRSSPYPPKPSIPPPAAGPSIHRQAATAAAVADDKRQKAARLVALFQRLRSTCPVCWLVSRSPVRREGHRFFRDCLPSAVSPRTDGDWIAWKKGFKYTVKYQYCYACCLPQGQYLPTDHAVPNSTTRCAYTDIAYPSLHAIYHFPQLWALAVTRFPEIAKFTASEFAHWCPRVGNDTSFSNGLELLLWIESQPLPA